MIDELEQVAIRGGKTLAELLDGADRGVTIGQALQRVAENPSAKYWIDNRHSSNLGMLRAAADASIA